MKFKGISKLTLLDYPEHLACTLFVGGCQFRCPFCHNSELVLRPNEETSFNEKEILYFLKSRVGRLEGVCITGGEPTMYPDLKEFIKKVKRLGFLVKLDTNGTNPKLVKELLDEELLDMIAMDIKSSLEHYDKAAGTTVKLDDIGRTVDFIRSSGIDYEFRTTLVRGLQTKEDMASIGKWLSGAKAYYLQNFVNNGNLIDNSMTGFTPDEMKEMLDIVKAYVPEAKLRGI